MNWLKRRGRTFRGQEYDSYPAWSVAASRWQRAHMRRVLAVAIATVGLSCVASAGWIHMKAYAAQVLITRAWDRAARGDSNAQPWPWADTRPVARLSTDGPVRQELLVLEGSSGRNLAFGPAHDSASVLPGERGNSVIAGHRDTHFRFLQTLQRGDRLLAERADGSAHGFVVTDVRVVDSRHERIALDDRAPRLTLVTCYPFDAVTPGGPLRYVVTADLESAQPRQLTAHR